MVTLAESDDLQVHASRAHIDKVQRSGTSTVVRVRESSDERENIRRINEEERRRVRRQVCGATAATMPIETALNCLFRSIKCDS